MNINNFTLDLQKLIAFNSVQTEPKPNAPFGEEVNSCLLTFLQIAKDLGFETVNYNGFAGEVVFGNGEDFGILCHLDIVPVGALSDWNSDPFTLVNDGEKLIGRGVLDNKGPALLILYALHSLKQEGFIPSKKIRLILGCNEESGWGCIDHLKKLGKMPSVGFSPDAEFPVIYAEKGIIHVEFSFGCNSIQKIVGGKASNMVCDNVICKTEIDPDLASACNLKIDGDVLQSYGKTAHGSTPHKGVNAIINVLKYLTEKKFVSQEILDKLFYNSTKIKNLCDETGFLTLSPNVIKNQADTLKILCDIRYPATISYQKILQELEKIAPFKIKSHQPSLFVDKNSLLVQTLSNVYKKVTKSSAKPIAIGGGTYARSMKNCVAFGPVILDKDSVCHEANEYMTIKNLKLAYQIYKETIKTLS